MPLTPVLVPAVFEQLYNQVSTSPPLVYFSESGHVPSSVLRHAQRDGVRVPSTPVSMEVSTVVGCIDACSSAQVFQLQEEGFVAIFLPNENF